MTRARNRKPRRGRWLRAVPPRQLWDFKTGRERVELYVRSFERLNGITETPIVWGSEL